MSKATLVGGMGMCVCYFLLALQGLHLIYSDMAGGARKFSGTQDAPGARNPI